jgi:glycerol kinase
MTAALRRDGHEPMVQHKTGLLLDPYFSGSKLAWLLDNVDGVRARGPRPASSPSAPIDSWLIWKLTGGKRHVTDATNAARTLLYNIREGRWDEDILKLLNIPDSLMPEVLDTGADFGTSDPAFSATPSRSSAWRATSRRRRWGRPVSPPAC